MATYSHCSCGEQHVVVSAAPVVQLVCHCEECRAFSGLACVKGAFFKKDDCHMTGQTNTDTLTGGTGAEKRHHSCSSCGAPVYVQVEALNGAIAILAQTLSPFDFRADAHVWTSQKASNTDIPPQILQSPGAPPDEIVKRMVKAFWH